MRVIPDAAMLMAPSSVRMQVSPDMVAGFATLTGDRSSLHVSDAFARRTAYRRPVVHGMLPVACLPLLPAFHIEGLRCSPIEVDARFVAPAFAGDALRLSTGPGQIKPDAAEVGFPYLIEHDESRRVVTRGTMTVTYEPAGPAPAGTSTGGDRTMLVRPVAMNDFRLDAIETGANDSLDFALDEGAVADLADIITGGLTGDAIPPPEVARLFHLPNLLAVSMFSTSVGVGLPGASATFLEFSARLERPVELDTIYRLLATVTHRSMATRIIKKTLCIAPADRDDDVTVKGKAATLVNRPFQRMPTIDALKDTALDWGLRDKVVLVTGSSRGIGETTAKLFALHGAKVIVNYHRGADDARRVADEIIGAGGDAVAVAADIASPDEVRALVGQAVDRYGTIHVLVNNAARDFRPVPFLKLTWDDVQKDLDVIAKGAFLCCQEIIPLMLRQGGGKIVNISTVATDDPPPDQTKYVMAKSALVGLTRSLSVEFASENIQVNLVVPNFVETDFVAHVPDAFRKKVAQDTPMRRNASPVDVARAVILLASSYSSFTTGQKVMVTGGGAPYA